MECEEEGKISMKDIPDLTDMPKYKAQTSMSKHFHYFEIYLSQHYRIEGFPLDYVVRPMLSVTKWTDAMIPHMYSVSANPDFFKFDETDSYCHRFVEIVPLADGYCLRTGDHMVGARYESGMYANC